MIKFRHQFLCVTASLFLFTMFGCQAMNAENASKDDSSAQTSIKENSSSNTEVEKTPQVDRAIQSFDGF